jgi:hypothetical protein
MFSRGRVSSEKKKKILIICIILLLIINGSQDLVVLKEHAFLYQFSDSDMNISSSIRLTGWINYLIRAWIVSTSYIIIVFSSLS